MADKPDLADSAQELSKFLEPGDLDSTLGRITTAAVELIPHVDYASITIRHGDERLETVTTTDETLKELDARQYALREGPCYDAATDRGYVVSSDLAEDPRFTNYGPFAVELGIRSQAAFRLFERNGVQGALNVYSGTPGAFDDLRPLSVLFQSQSAVAISYAYEVTGLNEAVQTRTTIGEAMGIVMERYQLNDERAFAFLTRLSQNRNIKLRLIAEEIVAEAADHSDVAADS